MLESFQEILDFAPISEDKKARAYSFVRCTSLKLLGQALSVSIDIRKRTEWERVDLVEKRFAIPRI